MTEDQFVELVSKATKYHVSLDPSVADDVDWELRNLASTIAHDLRLYGVNVPDVANGGQHFMRQQNA